MVVDAGGEGERERGREREMKREREEGGEAGRCWLGREEAGAEERERDESGKIEDRDDKVEAR